MVGRDWNVTFKQNRERRAAQMDTVLPYRDNIISAMNELHLTDIMLEIYPSKKMFSYEFKHFKSKRLIRFFRNFNQ